VEVGIVASGEEVIRMEAIGLIELIFNQLQQAL